jgi:hypothetical protein
MRELLRDYGPAIGPAFGLMAAVLMLWIRDAFDRRAAGRKAERRIEKIAEMLRDSPPPVFQNPATAPDQASAMLDNAVKFMHFYDRMSAVDGALKSAETTVHEHASVELIVRYHVLKQNLEIMQYERQHWCRPTPDSSPIPGEDNFFNATQAWRSMLAAADPTSAGNI